MALSLRPVTAAVSNLTNGANGGAKIVIPDVTKVREVILIYGALVAMSLGLYSILRKFNRGFVAPRLARSGQAPVASTPLCKVFDIDLSWSWKAFALREKDLIVRCGLDGYVFLRIVRFCWGISAIYCFFALCFLVPFFRSQSQSETCSEFCEGNVTNKGSHSPWDSASCVCGFIDRSSLAALPASSASLWMPVMMIYTLTVITLAVAQLEYRSMLRIRTEYWERAHPEAYTVLVEGVPDELRNESGDKLKNYFESMFPGEVFAVEMMDGGTPYFKQLVAIGNARNWAVWSLEDALARQNRPVTRCCFAHQPSRATVHSLDEELHILNRRFANCRDHYLRGTSRDIAGNGNATGHLDLVSPNPPSAFSCADFHNSPEITSSPYMDVKKERVDDYLVEESFSLNGHEEDSLTGETNFPNAFVTFRTLTSTTVAVQSQLDEKSSTMRVYTAPEPLDVAWNNVGISQNSRMARRAVTKTLYYLILLFWGVLTSVIGAVTSTQALSRQIPALRQLLHEHPMLTEYLNWFAPLVLVSVVGVVNPLMGLMSRFEARFSESAADKRTMERYFSFLVIQVFLFYSIAGTVFKTFVEILEMPSKIVNTLGSTIPKNAAFYIQYIIVQLFWMLCIELLRGFDCVLGGLRRMFAGRPITLRERVSLFCGCFPTSYPSPLNLPSTMAQILLVYFIAIVYAVIQPLILPTSFVFFALANLVYTTTLTTSRKLMYDSGGSFWWNSAYRCIVMGLTISQLTLIGVILIKQGYTQALSLWVLLFLTLYGGYRIERHYGPLVSKLSVHLASKIDRERQHKSIVQVLPPLWQYGAIRPGYERLQRNDAVLVFTYQHPVLEEPAEAKPFKFNLRPHFCSSGETSRYRERMNRTRATYGTNAQ